MNAWRITAFLLALGCMSVRAEEPKANIPPRVVILAEKGGQQPVSIAYRKGLSLVEAITAAGGFTDFGGGTAVYLIRSGKPAKVEILANRAFKDAPLEPWDIVLLK